MDLKLLKKGSFLVLSEGSMNNAGLRVCLMGAVCSEDIVVDNHSLYTSIENRKYQVSMYNNVHRT